MKTKYVYTEKAEQIARDNNLQEYRKAGTAASFAYQPLEESPITARAWLEAGIIEEAPEPVNFLTFTFTKTPAAHMIKLFNENHIKWYNSPYFSIYADINQTGEPVRVDNYFIGRDEITGLVLHGIKEAE